MYVSDDYFFSWDENCTNFFLYSSEDSLALLSRERRETRTEAEVFWEAPAIFFFFLGPRLSIVHFLHSPSTLFSFGSPHSFLFFYPFLSPSKCSNHKVRSMFYLLNTEAFRLATEMGISRKGPAVSEEGLPFMNNLKAWLNEKVVPKTSSFTRYQFEASLYPMATAWE